MTASTPWLHWAQRLQAMAQTGLTYTKDPYDRERYEELQRIAAEILATQTDAPFAKIIDLFQQQSGYPTPKVDVRGVVFRNDEILLVKEKEDGKWTLPGGWADILESPAEAVTREVWEESGFHIRVTKLLAVYDRSKHGHRPEFPFHIYKHFFLGEITGGAPTPTAETTAVGFFPAHALPELSISRVTPAQIARFFVLKADLLAPTDFD